MTTAAASDRRHFERVPFEGSVAVSPIPQSLFSTVRQLLVEDLSERGARLSSPEPYPADSRLLLDLESPDSGDTICTVGRVVWVEPASDAGHWRMGVAFSSLTASARCRLQEMLLSQGQPGP